MAGPVVGAMGPDGGGTAGPDGGGTAPAGPPEGGGTLPAGGGGGPAIAGAVWRAHVAQRLRRVRDVRCRSDFMRSLRPQRAEVLGLGISVRESSPARAPGLLVVIEASHITSGPLAAARASGRGQAPHRRAVNFAQPTVMSGPLGRGWGAGAPALEGLRDVTGRGGRAITAAVAGQIPKVLRAAPTGGRGTGRVGWKICGDLGAARKILVKVRVGPVIYITANRRSSGLRGQTIRSSSRLCCDPSRPKESKSLRLDGDRAVPPGPTPRLSSPGLRLTLWAVRVR